MLNRLAMAGHAMTMQMAKMETITNNLANISTKGFKREELFVRELKKTVSELDGSGFSEETSVPYVGARIDFSQGPLEGTNRPLDVAISGSGLFSVETPDGEAYTRDGRFTLNQEGILVTSDGHPVLGEGGPIEINVQENFATDIVINGSGEILLDGNIIDKFKTVSTENPADFYKIGSNLFQLKPGVEATALETVEVKQGFLESSNVDSITEMVTMIDLMHQYEMAQKMIKSQDAILGKAANEIGRVG
ncbi:MAG: flagellar basal-body rod protein FlgF [Caldithrix sp.]|nr:MAG: flagellar basal-body rod protein FlgF [Caldithrix sp.]